MSLTSHSALAGKRDPGARFSFVRIGCIFEIARCELRFFPVASVGCLANYPAIIERSLYPFRAAAAPMIDICVLAGRVMTRVNREHFRSPLSGRLYDFCTIRANALEVIDSRRVKMVDLVGIEPTTSSMPWKRAPSCATGPLVRGHFGYRCGRLNYSR